MDDRRGPEGQSLPHDGLAVLAFAQPDELGVAQVILGRPLHELESPHQHRRHPLAHRHLGLRQPLAPPAALSFGQVGERTVIDLEPTEPLAQHRSGGGREAAAGAGDVDQPVAFVQLVATGKRLATGAVRARRRPRVRSTPR